MRKEERDAHLQEAARPVLERIRADREGLKPHLRAMLDLIAERLLDSQLTATTILKASGIRDNSLPSQFHGAVGLSPRAYLEECRLEIATRLLVQIDDLKVGEIGELVGFTSVQSFSQAFNRWVCERPNRFRQRLEQAWKHGGELPTLDLLRSYWWQRAEDHHLGVEEAEMLVGVVEKTYNLAPRRRRSSEEDNSLQARETRAADGVWSKVSGLAGGEMAKGVQSWAPCFKTPALVWHLFEKARLEGRTDRQRGVLIGESALEAAVPLAGSLPPEKMVHLLIDATARMANLRRLAADLEGARRGFVEARALLAGTSAPADLEARLCYLECHLANCERSFGKALGLAERSLQLAKRGGSSVTIVHALLARGMAFWGLQDLKAAADSMRAASEQVDDCHDQYLSLATEQHLATVLAAQGQPVQARSSLTKAKALAERLGFLDQIRPHFDWVEALSLRASGRDQRAEKLLRRARQDFSSVSDTANMALVSLELALLLEEHGRYSELCHLMIETTPVLERLKLNDEGHAAILLLRRALDKQTIRRQSLIGLREHLYRQLLP